MGFEKACVGFLVTEICSFELSGGCGLCMAGQENMNGLVSSNTTVFCSSSKLFECFLQVLSVCLI